MGSVAAKFTVKRVGVWLWEREGRRSVVVIADEVPAALVLLWIVEAGISRWHVLGSLSFLVGFLGAWAAEGCVGVVQTGVDNRDGDALTGLLLSGPCLDGAGVDHGALVVAGLWNDRGNLDDVVAGCECAQAVSVTLKCNARKSVGGLVEDLRVGLLCSGGALCLDLLAELADLSDVLDWTLFAATHLGWLGELVSTFTGELYVDGNLALHLGQRALDLERVEFLQIKVRWLELVLINLVLVLAERI